MFCRSTILCKFWPVLLLGFNLAAGAADTADTNAVTLAWRVRLGTGYGASSPALAPDGTIYVGTFGGRLLALSPEGRTLWSFKTGSEIKSSPAVGGDGTVYFGSRDRKFYAVSSAGKLKWAFATGAWVDSSPAVAGDGTVYFGSWDRNFYALAPDGALKWTFATSNLITTSPAIAADGTIYFGSHDDFFYALTAEGKLKWKFLTGAEIDVSPAIAGDGMVYVGSTDGNLYALRPDGTEAWRLHTGSFTGSAPVLDADGNLYLAAGRDIVSVGRDGKIRWQHHTDVPMDMSPAVAGNSQVYLSIPWLAIGSIACTNEWPPVWNYSMNFCMAAAPNISSGGMVYASDGVALFALKPALAAPPMKSAWPLWRADQQHTGRVQRTE